MLEIELDGKLMEVPEGSTIMDAANRAGTFVPHFCYHKKLSIAANCRMCLVQVEKAPKPLPACATPVTNGMKVWTHSDAAVTAQKGVMEFLLINHPLDCPICDQGGECELQDIAVGYGGCGSRYTEEKRVVVNKNIGPLISTDMDYDSIAKAGSMLGSGAVIVMDETRCMVKSLLRLSYFYYEESCGQCTPCREGSGWLYRVVHRIEHGEGRPEDLDLLNRVTDNMMGKTICALADAAAFPVRSFIKHFQSEFEYHINNKKCLVDPDVQRAGSGFFKAGAA